MRLNLFKHSDISAGQGILIQQAVQCIALSHCENPSYGFSFLYESNMATEPFGRHI